LSGHDSPVSHKIYEFFTCAKERSLQQLLSDPNFSTYWQNHPAMGQFFRFGVGSQTGSRSANWDPFRPSETSLSR